MRRNSRLVLAACALFLGGPVPAGSLPSLRHVAVGVMTLSSGDDLTIFATDGFGEDTGFARVNGEEIILACVVIVERVTLPLHELYASGRSFDTSKTWRIFVSQSQLGPGGASVDDDAGVGPCSAKSNVHGAEGVFVVVP